MRKLYNFFLEESGPSRMLAGGGGEEGEGGVGGRGGRGGEGGEGLRWDGLPTPDSPLACREANLR